MRFLARLIKRQTERLAALNAEKQALRSAKPAKFIPIQSQNVRTQEKPFQYKSFRKVNHKKNKKT